MDIPITAACTVGNFCWRKFYVSHRIDCGEINVHIKFSSILIFYIQSTCEIGTIQNFLQ